MREEKDKRALALLMLVAACCMLLWFMLIIAKAQGMVGMNWPVVLLGIIWIPAGIYGLAADLADVLVYAAKFKRRRRIDREIRARAKAFGVWDRPDILGGRALEIYAWEHFMIKRREGETDLELRRRCMAQLAAAPGEEPKERGGSHEI